MTPSREGNAAAHFIDRHLVEGRSAKIACIDDHAAYSYTELAARVNRAGNALRRLDLKPGDRLLFCLLDGIDFIALFWGALKIGVIPIPVNTMLTADDYAFLLRDSEARVVVFSAPLSERLSPSFKTAPALRAAIVSGGVPPSADFSIYSLDSIAAPESAIWNPRRPARMTSRSGSIPQARPAAPRL